MAADDCIALSDILEGVDCESLNNMGGLVPSETGCGSAKTLPVGRGWLKKRIFRQRILDRTHSNANSLLGG